MRSIQRLKLAPATTNALKALQAEVDASAQPPASAKELWARKSASKARRAAFADVRKKLKRMSTGLERCMYCEDSAGTDIDHFRPKATYPNHTFRWSNYLSACSHCNSNEKRAAFPVDSTGDPLLLDPTVDDPYAHLQFVWQTGQFIGQTPRGMATESTFGLNRRSALERGRKNTWVALRALLELHCNSKDVAERARIREVVREMPFQAVVQHFLRDAIAQKANVPPAIAAEVIATQADWKWAL